MKNPFGRKARLHLSLALIGVIVFAHSGCGTGDTLRRLYLPPPPSEDLRSQLGRVRLSEGGMQTAVLFTAPAKGASAGMARGAKLGALFPIVAGGDVPFEKTSNARQRNGIVQSQQQRTSVQYEPDQPPPIIAGQCWRRTRNDDHR